jgi:hypothetical protein
MRIGIVGSEGAKFTKLGEERARDAIRALVRDCGDPADTVVVSGHCHLGGIDIYAEEVAAELGVKTLIFPPAKLNWSEGYKPRNLQIARNSDKVVCITVNKLPPDFKGMVFDRGCYHCKKADQACKQDHVKSGGCWTVLQAGKMGKEMEWIVISNS